MKKMLATAFVVTGMVGMAAAAETVTLAADSWAPFSGEPGDRPGSMVEITTAIFEKAGYKVEYSLQPWKRVLTDVAKGALDGAVGASDADGLHVPTEAAGMCGTAVFVRKDSAWRYTGIESLAPLTVGAAEAYTYGEPIDSYIAKVKGSDKLQLAGGDAPLATNIKKLAAGRLDAVLETPEVFWSCLKDMGLKGEDFIQAGMVIEPGPFYSAFTPNERGRKLAKIFDDGMAELRKSGDLAKILARYDMKDWK